MITRIVKMTFKENTSERFMTLFSENSTQITAFPGCQRLRLLRSIDDDRVIFTLSEWLDEASVENYRQSGLFESLWHEVKALFAAKPEAWSLNTVAE